METRIGAKFRKIPVMEIHRTDRTDGQTNGTEFQGPNPSFIGGPKTPLFRAVFQTSQKLDMHVYSCG